MKNHLRILFASLLALLSVYGLEKKFSSTPGLFVGALEVLLEVSALTVSYFYKEKFKWQKLQWLSLCCFAFFLLIGDGFYISFYYILQVGHPTDVISYLTTLPYCISFMSLFVFLFVSMRPNLKKHLINPLSIIPFIVLTPIVVKLAMPLFTLDLFNSFFKIIEISALTSSYLVFACAFLVFLTSKEIFWTHFSSGVLIFMFSDWAIKVEKFLGHKIEFVGYEFLWAFGVALSCTTLVFVKPKNLVIDAFDFRSIPLNSKLISLVLALASLFLVLLSQQEVELIKFITVSSTIGVLGSATLAQYHFDQLEIFSKSISDILVTGQKLVFSSVGKLPRELESSYRGIVQSKITELRENERKAARVYMAQQVAHDIRSPLAVLELLATSSSDFPLEYKNVTQASVRRIRDITKNLLQIEQNDSEANECKNSTSEPSSEQLLTQLTEEIVDEKKTQLSVKAEVKITLDVRVKDSESFVHIQPIEFKRVVSNIIDNSIDAILGRGTIVVKLDQVPGFIYLSVSDSGCGIPKEILPRLTKKGETHGKKGGTGLGLYHARNCCESWKGKLEIESIFGEGTKVVISLPRTMPKEMPKGV